MKSTCIKTVAPNGAGGIDYILMVACIFIAMATKMSLLTELVASIFINDFILNTVAIAEKHNGENNEMPHHQIHANCKINEYPFII